MKVLCKIKIWKGWLFFAANLFLFLWAGPHTLAQSWTDTIDSTKIVVKPKLSVFLHERMFVKDTVVVKKEVISTFLNPHLLPAHGFRPVAIKSQPNDWAFIVLLFCTLLVVWVQVYYQRRLSQIFKAVLTPRLFNQLLRGGEVYDERITVNLFIVLILVVPLFLFEINHFVLRIPVYQGVPFGYLLFYGELMLGITALYGLKMLILRMAGVIFKTGELTSSYILTHFIFDLTQGILLIPLIAIVIFNDSLIALEISIVLFCLFFLYRLVRGVMIGLTDSRFSVLYLLIFVLSLEIMPLVILWKIVKKYYLV